MRRVLFSLLTAILVYASGITETMGQSYDVPYVPTPQDVVDEMLRITAVGKDDILYDLGCGDGRIVITAAEKFGTRGVGIDIDPNRIKESNQNAIHAKVTDKVRFIQQNLFESDFSEATVVTLYLLPSVNLRLRPQLFRSLKPGTRIVSHQFDMGEWEPDERLEVDGDWTRHSVLFWLLPANVSGKWDCVVSNPNRKDEFVLEMDQHFQKVTANVTILGRSRTAAADIELKGDKLTFSVTRSINGRNEKVNFTGIVDGNTITGEVYSDSNPNVAMKWTARRDPSTIIPIDPKQED